MTTCQAKWPIPVRANAVHTIRAAVRKALADWGAEAAIDDNTLIVSELVTNAIRHGAPDITLNLVADDGRVIGAVTDQGRQQPRMRPMTDLDTGGRGLHLVNDLATVWGVESPPDGRHGKTVWWLWAGVP
jgi:Anti-sigma regulatory factor (Ser/Thr protein kinase)